MDQDEAGIALRQPCLGGVAARRRAVVHPPDHALPSAIRCRPQDVIHPPAPGLEAGCRWPPPPHVPLAALPGRQGWPRAPAIRRELATRGPGGGRTLALVTTAAGLEARLVVGTEPRVLGAQRRARPGARRPVKQRFGLLRTARVPGTAPGRGPPGLDGLRLEHPPPRAPTERVAQGAADSGGPVGQGLPTQRWLGCRDPCTGQRVVQGGKPGLTAPSRVVSQANVPLGLPPPLNRPQREMDPLRCVAVGDQGVLGQE